jgi:hypothetical protein
MPKKITIWPDIYREQGHWLPCVTLAKTLQGAGYSVRFMGIEDCRSIVEPYHANFDSILNSIYPQGHSFENRLPPIGQRWKPHHVMPIARGALDALFTGPSKPDLLIGGYFTGLETLILHRKYDVPFVLITTFLRHPNDTPASHAKTKLLYNFPDELIRALIDTVVPAEEEEDPESEAEEQVEPEPMDLDEFLAPLDQAQEIIPCPKAFDFDDPTWVHEATVRYVEPMIERASLTGAPVTIADPVIVPEGMKLIYATSGSMVQDYEELAATFFKNLIAMMQTQNMQNHYLVIGAGARLSVRLKLEYGAFSGGTSTLPNNVLIRDWVDQLELLGTARAVFVHGGLATIKEAIWKKVPIIIVPHGKDQADNALRVRRAGVGVLSEVGDASPTELRQLFNEATASVWIRNKLTALQALFALDENKPPEEKPSFLTVSGVVPP